MKKIYVILLTLICLMGFGLSFNKVEAAAGEAISIGTGTFNNTDNTITWNVDNVVTMVQRKGSSSNAVANYTGASSARFYSGHILEFTAIEGYSISKVEFKNSNNGSYVGSNHKLGTSLSGNSVTNNKSLFNYTEGTSTSSLVSIEPISDETGKHFYFQLQGKQTRPQSFTITYKSVNTNATIEEKFQTATVQSMLSFDYKTTSTSVQPVEINVNGEIMHGDNKKESTYAYGAAKLNATDMFYVDLTGFSGDIIYSGSFYHNSTSGTNPSTFDFVFLGADKTPIESSRQSGIVTEFITAPTDANGLSAQEFSYRATLTSDVKYLGIDVTKDRGNIALDLNIAGSKVTPTYDFENVTMKFKYEYDLSSETTVTDQGFVVTSDKTFAFTQGMDLNSFVEKDNLKRYSKSLASNASVGSFTIGISINTSGSTGYDYADCTKKLYVAAYIVVGGKMYFSNVCNNGEGYSVNDILTVYKSDIEGANNYKLEDVKEVISAFVNKNVQ